MGRKHRYRYRRWPKPERQPAYRPTNGELLVETLLDGVIAAVKGILRPFQRLLAPPTPSAPQPLPSARPAVIRLSPKDLCTHARPLPSPIPPKLPALSLPPGIPVPHSPAVARDLPYRRQPRLLSRGERAFWYPLYRAVRGRYRIFCKVRLADVVGAPPSRKDERHWFRKIATFHVDFVLCDPKTTAPLLVIELDDRSHVSEVRRKRDAFKQDVLNAAGVPLYRVRAQQAYDPLQLSEQIERSIASARKRAQ